VHEVGGNGVLSKNGNELLGVPIDHRSLGELVDAACEAVQRRRERFSLVCANPHSLVLARADQQFRVALRSASAVVADGVGCMVGAALAGVTIGPRITGSNFFRALMSALQTAGCGRVFFFGSSDLVLAILKERCRQDYPSLAIDTMSPPYGDWSEDESESFIERINASRPDVLWIGMTAPKQEKWMDANGARLNAPVIGCIGAVFDYYAGVVRRAPQWICDLGLEWLYRLAGEPSRLWRRTAVSAPQFLWATWLQRFGRAG
jgi:N-acetylglucosaminyldiphosphoundecaprenol N-acetyl-beta-D-mannosaminyltransferase